MTPALLTPDALIALRRPATPGPQRMHRPTTALPGGQVTRQRGAGLETMDIRPFTVGDDPRHVDRHASARVGRPQVRVFHAERDRALLLIADFRPAMLWGTRRTFRSVSAAEQLCRIGWQAVGGGARVGLVAITAAGIFHTPPRTGERGMIIAIGEITRAHAAAMAAVDLPDPPLADALLAAARLAPRGAETVLASALDTPGEAFEAAILRLGKKTTLRVERIADSFEIDPPPGHYRLRDGDGRIRSAAIRSNAMRTAPSDAGGAEKTLAFLGVPLRWCNSSAPPESAHDQR